VRPATRLLRLKLRLAVGAAIAVLFVWGLLGAALVAVLVGAEWTPATAAGAVTCEASPDGRARIPEELMALYARAAAEYGIGGRGVFVLAAINKVETDFGRNVAVSSAGAVGWMQFMPATWAAYGVDADGDGRPDPNTPADAIFAAARYLAASGAPGDWYRAIFAYNHADWYVREVEALADAYQGGCTFGPAPQRAMPMVAPSRLLLPVPGPVTSPFGPRWGRMHEGIDIAAPAGTPIRAVADGAVSFSGWADGYGNYVCVTHSARLTTCYAHLSRIDAPLRARLAAGDVIGAVGCTGRCFGDHLHFETRGGANRQSPAHDPMPLLTE